MLRLRRIPPSLRSGEVEAAEVAATYQSKVLATQSANLLGYWPLNETSGAQAIDLSGNGYHGLYVNSPSLANAPDPTGESVCPLFTRASAQYILVDNTTYNSPTRWRTGAQAASLGTEGTALIWCKLAAAAQWTDTNNEMQLAFGRNSTNYVELKKDGAAPYGRIAFRRFTGGADAVQNSVALNTETNPWIHIAITWSQTADETNGYVDGVIIEASPKAGGTWSGDDFRESYIGCYLAASNPWNGWLAHCAVWNKALTGPEILALATL